MENFFTTEEQLAINTQSFTWKFAQLATTLRASKEEFRALAESLKALGKPGEVLLGRLLNLAPAFSDLTDEIEDSAESNLLIWKTATKTANEGTETLLDTAGRLHLVAYDALRAFDGSEESMAELQSAIDARYSAELALINEIKSAIENIDVTIGSAIQDISLAGATDETLYNFYSTEANRISDALRSGEILSPEDISKAVSDATAAAMEAFNLLDDAGQAENRTGFISFLEGLGGDSKAILTALDDVTKASTVALAEETIKVVGINNIESDISSLVEIMAEVEKNTAFSNAIMERAINSTHALDAATLSSLVSDSIYESTANTPAGISVEAAHLISDGIIQTMPGFQEALLADPSILGDLSSYLLDTYNTRIGVGDTIEQAVDFTSRSAGSALETYVAPYNPTAGITEIGTQTYEDLKVALGMNEAPAYIIEQNQAATDQIEASNTMLTAATIIQEAAEVLAEASDSVPVYIETEGEVSV